MKSQKKVFSLDYYWNSDMFNNIVSVFSFLIFLFSQSKIKHYILNKTNIII